MSICVGSRVRVRHEQPYRYTPLCPGRVGKVAGVNGVDSKLLYVDLEPTKRAKARTALFHETSLELISYAD